MAQLKGDWWRGRTWDVLELHVQATKLLGALSCHQTAPCAPASEPHTNEHGPPSGRLVLGVSFI